MTGWLSIMSNFSKIVKRISMSPRILGFNVSDVRCLNCHSTISHFQQQSYSNISHCLHSDSASSLNGYIESLAQEIDKSLKVTYDQGRPKRISLIFETFLSLNQQSEKSETDEQLKQPWLDIETEGSDMEGAVTNLCTVSSNSNKAFSSVVKRITLSILEHEMLTDGSIAGENIDHILRNSLHGNLGFGLKNTSRLLYYYPEIFKIDKDVIEERIQNLRRHHLSEGFLQRAVSLHPKYLTLPQKKLDQTVHFIINDLDFKSSELPQLFLFSPQIFFDPYDVTEDKFHYIYFTMGYKKHYTLARHGILRYNIKHIRTRHLFLERRGQYQLADKQRNTIIANPKIKGILCSSDGNFCQEVAKCPLKEYHLFKEVLETEDALRSAAQSEEEENNKVESTEFADKLLKEMA